LARKARRVLDYVAVMGPAWTMEVRTAHPG
jgi:hypothetical protein